MVYRIDNRKKRHYGRYTVLGIVLGIALALGGVYVYDNYKQPILNNVNQIGKITNAEIQKTEPIIHNIESKPITSLVDKQPEISQNYQPITKSYSLDELKQITLDDINNYRTQNGLNQISMDNAKASQVWADHLLLEGCITHREGNSGPMQRYVDNDDNLQMVFENISGGYGTNWLTPDEAIKKANSEMMNNDLDQNNAHRDNILNANHRSVSIGIAYDNNKLILVEDFQEPIFANWKSFDMAYSDQKACW